MSSVHIASPALMPKPNKAQRVALQQEETRRLEHEKNLDTLSQPAECLAVGTKVLQRRSSLRTSKWRDKNQKTKKFQAAWMQPSVLKFFSVSDGEVRNSGNPKKFT